MLRSYMEDGAIGIIMLGDNGENWMLTARANEATLS